VSWTIKRNKAKRKYFFFVFLHFFSLVVKEPVLPFLNFFFICRNATVGPVKWFPPESLRDRAYSEKSDVWAYGITLIEITTGHEPYPGQDLLAVALKVRDDGYRPIDQIPSDCPPYLARVMEMCWGATPQDRPTFVEIVHFLEENAPSEARIGDGDTDMDALLPQKDDTTPAVLTNRSNKKKHKTEDNAP
jgi:serine/threonine protein kinase